MDARIYLNNYFNEKIETIKVVAKDLSTQISAVAKQAFNTLHSFYEKTVQYGRGWYDYIVLGPLLISVRQGDSEEVRRLLSQGNTKRIKDAFQEAMNIRSDNIPPELFIDIVIAILKTGKIDDLSLHKELKKAVLDNRYVLIYQLMKRNLLSEKVCEDVFRSIQYYPCNQCRASYNAMLSKLKLNEIRMEAYLGAAKGMAHYPSHHQNLEALKAKRLFDAAREESPQVLNTLIQTDYTEQNYKDALIIAAGFDRLENVKWILDHPNVYSWGACEEAIFLAKANLNSRIEEELNSVVNGYESDFICRIQLPFLGLTSSS